jgi:hypothetical protein
MIAARRQTEEGAVDCEICYMECICPGSFAYAEANGHTEGLDNWVDRHELN